MGLNVAEAKPMDVGWPIVRLNPKKLNVKMGDIVKIQGKIRFTGAIVWPNYPEDQDQDIIRMDGRIRQNLGVSVGDIVGVSRTQEVNAREILLSPMNVRINPSGPYVENFIRRKLRNLPITRGDIINIPIGAGRERPFQVVTTKPKGIVLLKQLTILTLRCIRKIVDF